MKNLSLFVCAAVVLASIVMVPELFAQAGGGGDQVTFTEIVSFSNIFDDLRSKVSSLVAGAIGLGLAIWAARWIFSVIKSMGRA